MRGAALVLACALCGAARADDADREHPVSKVITLLKDMVSQLEREAKEDEDMYEGMGCWCTTNDKEKTKAISDGEETIKSSQMTIEELTGKSAQLNEEIKTLDEEVSKNEKALDSASSVRTKQVDEFEMEEKSQLGTIASLKSAVSTMSKHHSGAFLQVSDEEQIGVTVLVQRLLKQYKEMVTPRQRKALESFAQLPEDYFDSEPTLAQSKQPQSGAIFGILGQMKETFETNLANSQKEEAENSRAFQDLKRAKTAQITSGQQTSQQKLEELADTDEGNARTKEALEDAQDDLEADTTFLADVKSKCAGFESEYAERKSTRQLEIMATTKALEFLSSDDAHDLFSRSLGFVQLASSGRRQAAERVLRKLAARRRTDPKVRELMLQVRLDSFDNVKKTLQTMSDKLIAEKEEEITKKEGCVEGFSKNSAYTSAANRKKEQLIAEIEDLTMTQDELMKAIATLKSDIAEMTKQMKYAGEDREKENHAFQLVAEDQRATQKLLTASMNILKGFYEKYSLVQAGKKAAQPAGFKKYEKNEKSGGVIGMIQGIIDDSKKAETEALYAEADAQKAYETFVKDTNESITSKTEDLIKKTEYKGKVEAKKEEQIKGRDETLTELQQLNDELHDLHISCDYLLKNWDVRTQARDEEIEALKQAVGMFSGATFSGFLQHLGQ